MSADTRARALKLVIGASTSRTANRLDAQLGDLITEENQSCREQSRSNAVWGGGAGERYAININRTLTAGTAETAEPTGTDRSGALDTKRA
jgi:hypothetical protein